jgi:predicted DsbA family dithiol-disulfide isomerase/uncharacterized membrane protein
MGALVPSASPSPAPQDAHGRSTRVAGTLALAVALGAALLLALRHLGAHALPGCGLDSPCQRALGGPFGTLPVLDWPLAFAGTSFFAAQLAAWLLARGAWPRSLGWLARLGGLGSLALLVLAFQQGTPCPYCIAAQLANLAFVVLAERTPGPARARRPELAFAAVALATSALFTVARARSEHVELREAERQLADSTKAIESGTGARAFTGRFLRGPERAPLRLVLFTDYQCPDCARIEREAAELVSARTDLSLSVKHFPLCKDCNRRARDLGQSPHPNACWAARAAEAAGTVGGPDGFWGMHRWLFARGGAFVDAELNEGLGELGLAPGPFLEAMHSPETLARVHADVEEALALGIQTTPMVFLNGVELRGWRAPDALRRAVESLAARAPAPAGPEADRPPDALAKSLEDWRLEPRVNLPRRGSTAPNPEANAGLEIVLWSDYLDASTRELDRRLRAFQGEHPLARYEFRHYPLDRECMPNGPNTHPGTCRAARAFEAARLLGPPEALWPFHERLMLAKAYDDQALGQAARDSGLDASALVARLAQADVLALVRADAEAARRLGVHSIPLLYVDGRRVPRWRLDGVDLLTALLDEALKAVEAR